MIVAAASGITAAAVNTGTEEKRSTTAPRHEPLLNNPMAKARSRAGNHSEIAFTPPGQLPASPSPSRNRQNLRCRAEFAVGS